MDDPIKQALFHAALSSDPPLVTDDPIVNHMVDQHMDDANVPYNENLYMDEIRAWRLSGGFLLSYKNKSHKFTLDTGPDL